MNPLERIIRDLIVDSDPLSVSEYMTLCLMHPEYGYYTSGAPIGAPVDAPSAAHACPPVGDNTPDDKLGGDFITAPEVSQMFGELIGVWCMQMWRELGSPSAFNLVEAGPGRGTLMADLLRATKTQPDFHNAACVYRLEISDTLARQQESLLHKTGVTTKRVLAFNEIPDRPTLVVANEFLDALPFRQWVKVKGNWHERGIAFKDDQLCFAIKPNRLDPAELPSGAKDEPEGMIFETAPAREAFLAEVADKICKNSGAALLIDYGHTQPGFGDTFQAVRNHQYTDPLSAPGECDLTNHVDFSALTDAVKSAGCTMPEPVEQGTFLLRLGLLERAGQLGSGGDAALQESLRQAVERLAGPGQMGRLFKVMGFGSRSDGPLKWPGFH